MYKNPGDPMGSWQNRHQDEYHLTWIIIFIAFIAPVNASQNEQFTLLCTPVLRVEFLDNDHWGKKMRSEEQAFRISIDLKSGLYLFLDGQRSRPRRESPPFGKIPQVTDEKLIIVRYREERKGNFLEVIEEIDRYSGRYWVKERYGGWIGRRWVPVGYDENFQCEPTEHVPFPQRKF